jgi:hypothetical protein
MDWSQEIDREATVNREWYSNIRQLYTHVEIERLFAKYANGKNAGIIPNPSGELVAYLNTGGRGGKWLLQSEINDICARIDAQ